MRILSGTMKNKKLPCIKNAKYRPTSSSVREAIFNLLATLEVKIEESTILDLFAGTGSMAFEALSRYAKSAVLVDIAHEYVKAGQKFIQDNNLDARYIRLDVKALPKANQAYDVVFADPPYGKELLESLIVSLIDKHWVKKNSIIVLEFSRTEKAPNVPQTCSYLKDNVYGLTRVVILKVEL